MTILCDGLSLVVLLWLLMVSAIGILVPSLSSLIWGLIGMFRLGATSTQPIYLDTYASGVIVLVYATSNSSMMSVGCPWRSAHLGAWANDSCALCDLCHSYPFGLGREAVAARTLSGASGPEAALPAPVAGLPLRIYTVAVPSV